MHISHMKYVVHICSAKTCHNYAFHQPVLHETSTRQEISKVMLINDVSLTVGEAATGKWPSTCVGYITQLAQLVCTV